MYNKMSSYETASSDGDLCHRVCDPDPYYESSGTYYTQLYPADSQNTGTQVTSASGGGGSGGGVIMMDEEGYWGSPCSSSESHPDMNRDQYSPPAVVSASGNGSIAVGGTTIRALSSSQHQLPDQSSLSTSSSLSSASSTTSSSVSASSSPYGGAGHAHTTGGYHHHHHHHRHQSHDQQQQQQHHHQQIPSSMYCSSIVYEKTNAAGMYVPDEGYYGGTGASIDAVVSGTTGNEHQSSPHLHMTPSSSGVIPGSGGVPVVRVVKRRNTANKKERRRTQSINSAYTSLRDRIPNVPNDTKLSKIKTLRLAISYIAHLLAVVNGNQDPSCDFRAELVPSSRKINAERRAQKSLMQNFTANGTSAATAIVSPPVTEGRKIKGRTGWPQHVWALETKTTIK